MLEDVQWKVLRNVGQCGEVVQKVQGGCAGTLNKNYWGEAAGNDRDMQKGFA